MFFVRYGKSLRFRHPSPDRGWSRSGHSGETHSYACSAGILMRNTLDFGSRYRTILVKEMGKKPRVGIDEPAKARLWVICVRENHRYEEVGQAVAHAKMIKRVDVTRRGDGDPIIVILKRTIILVWVAMNEADYADMRRP